MSLEIKRAKNQGDPGIFGTLGKIAKGATGFVGGLNLPGISGVARTIGGLIPGTSPSQPRGMPRGISGLQRQPSGIAPPVGARPGIGTRSVGGFTGGSPYRMAGQQGGGVGVDVATGQPTDVIAQGGPRSAAQFFRDNLPALACPKGYRPNRSAYYRMTPQGNVVYIPKGFNCVRYRRRNPANAKANSTAIARLEGAKNMAKHLSRVTIRKKDCG